jgi:protein TonB
VHVGGVIQAPKKVTHVAPVYPALALAARVSGIVVLEAVIDEDGHVREVRVLRSTPLLDQAAIEAVRQWRFSPTLLNGQPVPVAMTVTVGFGLK